LVDVEQLSVSFNDNSIGVGADTDDVVVALLELVSEDFSLESEIPFFDIGFGGDHHSVQIGHFNLYPFRPIHPGSSG
jgi:hypothetical protein